MSTQPTPIVVDLDGTLTPTDTLIESVFRLLKQSPLIVFTLCSFIIKGRAEFKRFVAMRTTFSADSLPYFEPLLELLKREHADGRLLYLATASHKMVADKVAIHLGIFEGVIATESINLKGDEKLKAIIESLGHQFIYAGDSRADLPIWKSAEGAIIVRASDSTSKAVHRLGRVEAEFPRSRFSVSTWIKLVRMHQWLKNLLLFVPLLTAFAFLDTGKVLNSIWGFFSFSLVASATYIINDILDLENDRVHPRKKTRPLASAVVPLTQALTVSATLMTCGLFLASTLSTPFFLIVVLYLILTSIYSWCLKKYVLIDVILLATLYTIRIVAGAVVTEIYTSSWLLAFSVFVFISLALVKRCSELVSLAEGGVEAASGRDYRVTDLTVLWPFGVGTAVSAVVVFGLFINSPETTERYGTPLALWGVALGLVYWLSRLWIKTARGEMHDDPIVFAVTDRGSIVVVLSMVTMVLAAHVFEIGLVS